MSASSSGSEPDPRSGRPAPAFFLAAALALFAAAAPARAQEGAPPAVDTDPPGEPVLTRVADVLKLSSAEADRGLPVRLEGTVTLYEADHYLFFLQDASGGIYISAFTERFELGAGQRAKVEGITGKGQFSPVIKGQRIVPGGPGPLPHPRPATVRRILDGNLDSQWVELRGTVWEAQPGAGAAEPARFEIVDGLDALRVFLPGGGPPPGLGAEVVVRGVGATYYSADGKLAGFQLCVPSIDQVEVETTASQISRQSPVSPLAAAANLRPGRVGPRLHVRGVVTAVFPGEGSFFVRDSSGGAEVFPIGDVGLMTAGAAVDILAFPSAEAGLVSLHRADVEVAGPGPLPLPARAGVPEAAAGHYQGDLIQLSGIVVEGGATPKGFWRLLLKEHGLTFSVHIPSTENPSFNPGARVRVKGICRPERRPGNTAAFSVHLPSPADIEPIPRHDSALHYAVVWGGGLALAALGLWALFRRRTRRAVDTGAGGRENPSSRGRAGVSAEVFGVMAAAYVGYFVATHTDVLANFVAWSRGRGHGETDEVLTLAFIAALALSIFSFRRWRDLRREVEIRRHVESALVEREGQLSRLIEHRERIGRDLHDGVIQSIYAVGLTLEDCREHLAEDPGRQAPRIAKCTGELDTVMREIRRFIEGLDPDVIQGKEFPAALKSVVLSLKESADGNFSLQVDPEAAAALSNQEATELFYIAREAMANSLRYARARKTTVTLGREGGGFRLRVSDDGAGFDRATTRTRTGLENIQSRAEGIGGRLHIASTPGEGTVVTVDIPRVPAALDADLIRA